MTKTIDRPPPPSLAIKSSTLPSKNKIRKEGTKKIASSFASLSLLLVFLIADYYGLGVLAQNCGRDRGGAVCAGGLCCSKWGFCGSINEHCGEGCQSQCTPPGSGVASLISQSLFDQMFKHRNENSCEGRDIYTYNAFITATKSFPAFGTTGDTTTRKREIDVFLLRLRRRPLVGADAPDGPYAWGYCFVNER
ncbi:hypothetical protein AMTR_s00001p00244240 [Amborella trichopoda]|uniref:Chitin-binding type-1 domain-containing protein n=1 Tax=Amborella trichopoda TaxID=13333 RepID=W1NLN0_AMBTC|nr:hypothetical protein AMTR_s00001p00244240 [Amborella trichopoda]